MGIDLKGFNQKCRFINDTNFRMFMNVIGSMKWSKFNDNYNAYHMFGWKPMYKGSVLNGDNRDLKIYFKQMAKRYSLKHSKAKYHTIQQSSFIRLLKTLVSMRNREKAKSIYDGWGIDRGLNYENVKVYLHKRKNYGL